MINETIAVIITSMLPISELRGGIPLGIALGLDPFFVILISIIFNSLVFFPIYFGLSIFYEKLFSRIWIVKSLIERIEKRKKTIERYGLIGLTLFVGIPSPFTGAWTGSALAWLLRFDWKKSFFAIFLGVVIAGAIVSAISLGLLALIF